MPCVAQKKDEKKLEITYKLNDFLSEFSNVTLFKKWGRFTLPAKKSHVKEGDDNSGKRRRYGWG